MYIVRRGKHYGGAECVKFKTLSVHEGDFVHRRFDHARQFQTTRNIDYGKKKNVHTVVQFFHSHVRHRDFKRNVFFFGIRGRDTRLRDRLETAAGGRKTERKLRSVLFFFFSLALITIGSRPRRYVDKLTHTIVVTQYLYINYRIMYGENVIISERTARVRWKTLRLHVR